LRGELLCLCRRFSLCLGGRRGGCRLDQALDFLHGPRANALQAQDFILILAHLQYYVADARVAILLQGISNVLGQAAVEDRLLECCCRDRFAQLLEPLVFHFPFRLAFCRDAFLDHVDELDHAIVFFGRQRAVFGFLCQHDLDALDGGGLVFSNLRVRRISLEAVHYVCRSFRQTLDINAPAGQLSRQAGVLPIATDGQAELILGDDHRSGLTTTRFFV